MLVFTVIGRLATLVLFAALIVPGTLGVLLYSEAATRWALDLAQVLAGERVAFGQVEGTLPRGLRIQQARVQGDGYRVSIERVSVQWGPTALLQKRLHVPNLHLETVRVLVEAPDPDVELEPEPMILPESVPIPMVLALDRFRVEDLVIMVGNQAPVSVDTLELGAVVTADEIFLRGLAVHLYGAALAADGTIGLAAGFPFQLDADWELSLPDALVSWLGNGQAQGRIQLSGDLLTEVRLLHHLEAGLEAGLDAGLEAGPAARIVVESDLQIFEPLGEVRFASQHQWQALLLTVDPDRTLQIESGTLAISGNPTTWQAELTTGVKTDDWPRVGIDSQIRGNRERIQILRLALEMEDGHINAIGHLGLEAALPFELSIQAQDLNLETLWPEGSPFIQAMQLHVEGSQIQEPTQLRAILTVTEMRGALGGQPMEIQGRATRAPGILDLQDVRVAAGMNHLMVDGQIGDDLNLRWNLVGPDLALLSPELQGRIEASGRLTGSPAQPRLLALAEINELRHQDTTLSRGHLDIDAGLGLDDPFRISLEIDQAAVGATQVERLSIQAEGQASSHRITLRTEALNRLEARLDAHGAYSPETIAWTGTLVDLVVTDADVGRWHLTDPMEVRASTSAANFETVCLAQDPTRVCVSGEWDSTAGAEITGWIESFDLANSSAWWPDAFRIHGMLAGRFSGRMAQDGSVTADVELLPATGRIEYDDLALEEIEIQFQNLRLLARLEDGQFSGTLGVDFPEMGQISARFAAQLDAPDIPIAGEGQVILENLGWLGLFTDAVEDPNGRIEADLRLGGTARNPLPSGHVRLHSAQVGIPELGRVFSTPLITLEMDELGQGTFSGDIRSDETSLKLLGEIHSGEAGLAVTANLFGLDFFAVGREDLRVWVSPNVQLTWSMTEILRVRGSIVIPRLYIDAPELPEGAIDVSADEYLVDENIPEKAVGPGIDLRLRIILGHDVRFDGFGLQARFSGDVDLSQMTGEPLQAFGEIVIAEGEYRAYGQDLRIEKGSLLLQGPPTDPALDIRAERRIRSPEVVVGIHIGGTASALRSTLFSEPPMDDTDALSFLVTGRALGGRSDATTGQMLTRAATSWGLDQAAVITQRLGQELGLTELDLDTDSEEFEGGALVIGQRLSPRLLLRYSIGLFERGQKLMLQYEITDNLRLETSSTGEHQGADLIYRIER